LRSQAIATAAHAIRRVRYDALRCRMGDLLQTGGEI
jgi:hypothetical protein